MNKPSQNEGDEHSFINPSSNPSSGHCQALTWGIGFNSKVATIYYYTIRIKHYTGNYTATNSTHRNRNKASKEENQT